LDDFALPLGATATASKHGFVAFIVGRSLWFFLADCDLKSDPKIFFKVYLIYIPTQPTISFWEGKLVVAGSSKHSQHYSIEL